MPSTSPTFTLPHISDLTDFALSLREATADAAEWQQPALRARLDDLFELLIEHDRYLCDISDDCGDEDPADDDAEAEYAPISGEGRYLLGGE